MCFNLFHLPKFTVPDFDGDVLEWESFRDQFQGVLQKTPNLSNVHKLLLLQQHLKGDAADMLKNTPIVEDSFEGAWNDLEKRYGNKRILLTYHMNSLIELPAISKTHSHEIKRVLDFFKQSVRSFESLNIDKNHWNHWLVFLLSKKLDTESRLKWETSQTNAAEFPKYDDLCKFLETWSQALEAIEKGSEAREQSTSNNNNKLSSKGESSKHSKKQVNVTSTQSSKSKGKVTQFYCILCKSNEHTLSYCTKFKSLQGVERFSQAKKLKVCYNCLKDHFPNPCPSKFHCKTCSEKHHTLLHGCFPPSKNISKENFTTKTVSNQSSNNFHANTDVVVSPPESGNNLAHISATLSTNRVVLLATAKVCLFSPSGKFLMVKALLDTGSDTSLVSEWVVQSLGLNRISSNTIITGVEGRSVTSKSSVEFCVKSLYNESFSLSVEALVLKKVTSVIPSKTFFFNQWPHIFNLELADPEFYKSAAIDLILGADVCGMFFSGKTITGPPGTPSAHETPLGYVLMGPVNINSNSSFKTSCVISKLENTEKLYFDLQHFWEIEDVGQTSFLSPEELECEKHFQETHSRKPSGRYIVKLPLSKDESIQLGPTRPFAVKMLNSMERKMESDKDFGQKYIDNIKDLLKLGHMIKIPHNKLHNPKANYISHHGVFKVHDIFQKLRVVFHASHKTSTGFSLNSKLLTGPKLQADLWVILTRWRFFKVVFTTDIVKMFRQIAVHYDDWDWQRIVWRDNKNNLIEDYWITVVMFGQACAPYLALRCKDQLILDEGEKFPLASISLKYRTYVDDIFEGADNDTEALKIKNELIELLALGGFPLSKWSSNCSSLAEKSDNLNIKDSESVNTLGVVWSPILDVFNLKVDLSLKLDVVFSKRTLLSEISKLYDPLGWYSPVIIVAKILIQDLWLLKLSWDDKLPEAISKHWSQFKESLPILSEITLPRWVSSTEKSEVEFHCFSDASERAYAAVIYVVIKNEQKRVSSLLVSKTRVAPIKKLSIPRLELCAAELLSKLANNLIPQLRLKNNNIKIFGWSDSVVVLTWLNSHPSKWKPFVAHRVASIQNSVVPIQWRYVPTKSNPADIASRGISALELKEFSLWWQGPSWLAESIENWPILQEKSNESKVNNESKSNSIVNIVVAKPEPDIFLRYSNLDTLIKVIDYALRFIDSKNKPGSEVLLPKELEKSLCYLTKISQKISFPTEYNALSNNKKIPNTSPLLSLRPFLDENGCIRVGGRLRKSFLSFNEKHPFLISKNTAFAKLLIYQAHNKCLHGGQELTRNILLQRFWIVQGRSFIRSTLRGCVICAKYHARSAQQLMGQIPASRLKPEKPFNVSGVDYAGPFYLKASSGRGIKTTKGYICLFVCLVTKAVHLEVVTSLSTKSFLAAFERFISRRGNCSKMYSDNATNFKGAEVELSKMFIKASEFYKNVSHDLISKGTTWSFIPPGAPHFGGLWEAGVKTVKSHLRKVIGETKLTYEEMSTFLCKVESCLNSRPLFPLSNDPTDLLALTPAHFLTGEPINAYPEVPSDLKSNLTPADKYKLIKKMRDQFWDRWSKEYIHHLQQYQKWKNPSNNIKVGDMVLLKDNSLSATKWPLARVIEVRPGDDELVRVAKVKSATGIYERSIVKLAPLPVR